MITLSETTSPSKSLDGDHSGSIVFRFSSSGHVEVEILADQSDEEDTLRQRITAARPVLELLDRIFNVDPVTSQGIR